MLEFRCAEGIPDELWYGVSEKRFTWFLQGWARAFADPVEVGVHRHAEGAVCVLGFVMGVCGVQ